MTNQWQVKIILKMGIDIIDHPVEADRVAFLVVHGRPLSCLKSKKFSHDPGRQILRK